MVYGIIMILEHQAGTHKNSLKSLFGILIIPFLIYLFSIIILNLEINNAFIDMLSIGVTYDLTATAPIVYLILIWKKSIPKFTVIPITIVSIVMASFIIPVENQMHLDMVKKWGLPFVETFGIILVVVKVRKIIRMYKTEKINNIDIFSVIKKVILDMFPKLISSYLIFEIGFIYYAFIRWRKNKNQANQFSYSSSGILPILMVFMFMLLLETILVHILLSLWSSIAAWILTGISIYTFVQLFALLKSIILRPIEVRNSRLFLRYGILRESEIYLKNIYRIEMGKSSHIESLSPFKDLEDMNLIIHLNEDCTIFGIFGEPKKYRSIGIFVDNKLEFIKTIEEQAQHPC